MTKNVKYAVINTIKAEQENLEAEIELMNRYRTSNDFVHPSQAKKRIFRNEENYSGFSNVRKVEPAKQDLNVDGLIEEHQWNNAYSLAELEEQLNDIVWTLEHDQKAVDLHKHSSKHRIKKLS